MAGEGVNREVKLTIVVEGEEAARKKIESVVANINSTKMGEVDIPYKPSKPKEPKEPKVGTSSYETRDISKNAKSLINDFKAIKDALNRALGKGEESPSIRANESKTPGIKDKNGQFTESEETFGKITIGWKNYNENVREFNYLQKQFVRDSLTRLIKLYPEFVTIQQKMNYGFSNTMSKFAGGNANVDRRNNTSDVKISEEQALSKYMKSIIDHENTHALSIEKNIYNALKDGMKNGLRTNLGTALTHGNESQKLEALKEFIPGIGKHLKKTIPAMNEKAKGTKYKDYFTVENTFKEVLTELLTKLDGSAEKTFANMRNETSTYLEGFKDKTSEELTTIVSDMSTIILEARKGAIGAKGNQGESPLFNAKSTLEDVSKDVAAGLKENLASLKDISTQLKDNAIKLREQRLEAQRSLHGLKGVKGEDTAEDRKELNETVYNINDALKANQIEQARAMVEASVLKERLKELSTATKGVVEPEKNMRQQLTGMLIWMRAFRVFGEYSQVLKNQFVMLGNSLGMILNQVLIPLYPIIVGITKALYIISGWVGAFMKWLGQIPSAILALILTTLALGKLFGFLTWTMFGHRKAVDADTAALLKHTLALGGSAGTEAVPIGIGDRIKSIFVSLYNFIKPLSTISPTVMLIAGAGLVAFMAYFSNLGTILKGGKSDPLKTGKMGQSIFEPINKIFRSKTGEGSPGYKEEQNKLAEKHLAEVKIQNKFAKEQTQPWYMTIKAYLQGIYNILMSPFNAISNIAKNTIGAAIDIGKAIWDWLVASLGNTWDAATKIGGLILDWIKGGFKDPLGLVTSIIGVFIEWINREFKETYNLAGKIAEIIEKWVENTLPGGSVAAGAMRGAGEFIDKKKNEISPTISNTEKTIQQSPIIIQNTFNGIINPEELARTIKNSLSQVNTGGGSLSW